MPYILEDLVIDRVDLVDEGANTAASISFFKRKEQGNMDYAEVIEKMKEEHATIVTAEINRLDDIAKQAMSDLTKAREDLEAANETLEKTKEELEIAKKANLAGDSDPKPDEEQEKARASFDEDEILKSAPDDIKEFIQKMKLQKEAAETELRKTKEAEEYAIAKAKATELKSLPVDQETLISLIKSGPESLFDVFKAVSEAIDSTVLTETGSRTGSSDVAKDANPAWAKIEAEADKIVKSKEGMTKQKAIAEVINVKPDLYKEYLDGGAF